MTAILRKATPVLIVERIEPVLPFWEKLGLTTQVQVPDAKAGDGRLGFVILASDGIELMYQTFASVQADIQASALMKQAYPERVQVSVLYIEVDNLAQIEARLEGITPFMPRRSTFYGAAETGYLEPGGNWVIFAQQGVPAIG